MVESLEPPVDGTLLFTEPEKQKYDNTLKLSQSTFQH